MENPITSLAAGLGDLSNFGDLDLTKVDTSYPVIGTGQYLWKIGKVSIDSAKTDASRKMLVFEALLQQDANDKNGKPIQPGYKLTHRIVLTPSEKRGPDMVLRDICSLLDAVYGEAGRKAIDLRTFDMAALVNQTFMAKTSIDPEDKTGGYPEQARLARFIAKEGDVSEIPAPVNTAEQR